MSGHPIRRNLPLLLAVALLTCMALGLASIPRLRHERETLIRLQNRIDRAAAPDEDVLVDNRWLARC